LFEGLVYTTLLAYRDYRRAFTDIRYWAPSSSLELEVDFLVIRGDEMIAVEVKSGATFNETWCKGLRAFGTPPGVVRRIVVCPDSPDMRTADGIEVLSYRRLASILHEGTLFKS
jgi:predicted AAA+ superfamily ATPase